MLKPDKKDFTEPYNDKLVFFDSKGYTKAIEPYVNHIEKVNAELLKALELIISNSNDHAMIRIAVKALKKATEQH